jgi:hypothetical protein
MAFVDSPVQQYNPLADPLADPLMGQIKGGALQGLLGHWRAARGDRLMPGWRDIDPCGLKSLLPYLWSWVYDRRTDNFTGRIAGEEINALFGHSLRHVPMAEFFKNWDYTAIFQRYKRVVCRPSICIVDGPIFSRAGRRLTGQQLILPLATDGEHVDGIIGATMPEQTAAASPDILDRRAFDEIISGVSRLVNIGEVASYFPPA